jgi:hypothetical protein
VSFALLNLQFSVLCFARSFFSCSFDHCINYRSFSELRLLIFKLFFAVRLRFPLTWSFTTKNIHSSSTYIYLSFYWTFQTVVSRFPWKRMLLTKKLHRF